MRVPTVFRDPGRPKPHEHWPYGPINPENAYELRNAGVSASEGLLCPAFALLAEASLAHLLTALRRLVRLVRRAMRYVCSALTAHQASMLYLPALHEVLKL
jgi:hypothetical protein